MTSAYLLPEANHCLKKKSAIGPECISEQNPKAIVLVETRSNSDRSEKVIKVSVESDQFEITIPNEQATCLWVLTEVSLLLLIHKKGNQEI